jgi:DUF1009 family protein
MPAAEKSSVMTAQQVTMLGVIAGGGELPSRLLSSCDKSGTEVFVIGFENQTDTRMMAGRKHMITRLGAAGQIINTLRSHQIKDLVLIGSIRRPSLAELKPDLRTAKFFARLGLRAVGDNDLLTALRYELEQEGFTIHGVQNFVGDLIAPEGLIGRHKPKKDEEGDIRRGIEVTQALGRMDVGQAAVMQEGIVLGVEGVEGTDELIRRCTAYRRKGRGPILVKTAKPGQDRDLDLPTIGPETVILCAEAGFSGIALQAGSSLLLDPQKVAELADRSKMFVIGVNV